MALSVLMRTQRLQKRKVTAAFQAMDLELINSEKTVNAIEAYYQTLQESYKALAETNQKIVDKMIEEDATDDVLNKEYDEALTNEQRFNKITVEVRKFLKPKQDEGSGRSTQVDATPKLPKITIPVFSGEHKDWLGWWAIFSRIDSNPNLDAANKFTYLSRRCEATPGQRTLWTGILATAENYPNAIKTLKERFGKNEILIDVYIRELQTLMFENAVNKKEKTELVTLFDMVETYLNALDTLGNIDKSHFLYPMVESCLPVPVMRAWQRSPNYQEQVSQNGEAQKDKLKRLMELLASEVEGETRIALASKGYSSKDDQKKNRDTVFRNKKWSNKKTEDLPTAMGLVSLDDKNSCIFCDKNHPSGSCYAAAKMTLEEKRNKIKKTGKCLKCINGKHLASNCTERVLCSTCGAAHHKLLCPGKGATYKAAPPPQVPQNQVPAFPAYAVANPSASQVPVPTQFSMSNFNASPNVLLPTLMVGIVDAEGRVHRVRAAIDTMSGHTYISKRTVSNLKIPPYATEVFRHAVFGGATQVVEHEKYLVTLMSYNGDFSMQVHVYDQEQIASGIPSVPSRGVFEELLKKGIILSDHPSQRLQPIDLLIGGDVAGDIITGAPIKLDCGPLALETKFGWTVIGQTLKSPEKNTRSYVEHSLANLHSPKDMWKLEAIGITDPAMKLSRQEEDAIALEQFSKTVQRNPDGRYQVALPWIEGHPPLPHNKAVAQKRLESATNKLRRQQMYEDYEKIFEEWRESGIIEEIEYSEIQDDVHYLPHRPVVKEESATTKVRPVFDASCKKEGEPSLNDCLVKGPNLMEKIPNCILEFREDRVAAIADIRKAFLMIEVKKEDCDFLRFLWWKTPGDKELKTFRHTRVVFGMTCSTFLLNAVIDYHLTKQTLPEDSEVVKKLKSSLYVDNVAASFSTSKDYEIFRRRSIEILAEARFDLRLWESNIDEEVGPEPSEVLGMKWNRISDTLFCDCALDSIDVRCITKRSILSANNRVYDPLGMLAPVVLVTKQLFQECCKLKLAWDDRVPEEIEREFLKWLRSMKKIKEANISRYLGVPTTDSSIHIFCDASDVRYGAVAYLRQVEDDEVSVKFIMCRSRVAPLEKITINRLELIGCEIATRLGETIRDALEWRHIPITYWTDSTTARAWILRDRDWGTFVGNRVRKVRAVSSPEQWKHVHGILNPADLPSRGCSLEELIQSSWWKGPSWPAEDPSKWPDAKAREDEDLIMKEAKKKTLTAVNLPVEEPWYSPKVCKFSVFRRIVNTIGWMLRFATNSRRKAQRKDLVSGPLSLKELEAAEKKILFRKKQR